MFLSEEVKIIKVADAAGAGTSDVTGTAVDMKGYDGVIFLASYGTAAANNLMHAEQSSDNGSADAFTDIAGSEMNLEGASDEDQVLDILQPQERYVRVIAQRGTSSTLENIWAVLYKSKSVPQDNTDAGTIVTQRLLAPIAGTK